MSFNIENFETILSVKNNIQALRNKVLELAIHGKLVEQDPNDESASELLKKIQAEREKLIKEGKSKKQKPMEPIYEVEIPFKIPVSWEFTKINEIAFVTKLAGFEYTEYIAPNITSVGIPLFKGKNVQSGQLVYEFESFIPKKISDELIRSKVNKKCLLTPYVGTIGNISIFDDNNEYHLGANVGKIEFFNDYKKYLLEEYALYYFRSNYGNFQLKKHKKSTAQESISIEAIRDCIIPVPPINEQYRIVSKIESLMFEIDKLEESLQKKEHLMKLLPKAVVDAIGKCQTGEELKEQLQFVIENFESVFQTPESMQELRNVILQLAIEGKLVPQDATDEPASDLVKRIQVERDKLVKEGKIKKQQSFQPIEESEIPFEIPDSWEWARLDEISECIQRGKSPKYSIIEKYPVIAQKCIQWTGVSLEKALFIDLASIEKYTKERFLLHGDLLWNSTGTGTCGRVGKFTNSIRNGFEKIVADSHVTVVRCLEQYVNYDYLFIWLKSPEVQSEIESKASGSTNQIELSTATIKKYLISIPPLLEQYRIVQKVESIMKSINQMEVELKRKVDLVEKMAII